MTLHNCFSVIFLTPFGAHFYDIYNIHMVLIGPLSRDPIHITDMKGMPLNLP